MYEEFAVKGGAWKAAREERARSPGAYTKAGSWAASEAEARYIEACVDADEKWDELIKVRGGGGRMRGEASTARRSLAVHMRDASRWFSGWQGTSLVFGTLGCVDTVQYIVLVLQQLGELEGQSDMG